MAQQRGSDKGLTIAQHCQNKGSTLGPDGPDNGPNKSNTKPDDGPENAWQWARESDDGPTTRGFTEASKRLQSPV